MAAQKSTRQRPGYANMTDISPLQRCLPLLACPICGQSLAPSGAGGNALQCANKHSFDVAREPYVNLLLKKAPADTKEMLQARRQFLERGHYAPLSNQINELVYRYLTETVKPAHPAHSTHQHNRCTPILDAGCGEGYYLGSLKHFLDSQSPDLPCCYLGIDSSKEAVRMGARHYKDKCFIVASIKERLPLTNEAVQIILNIFAPRNAAEFARVLVPAGLLLVVIPGPNHLLPLRTMLSLLNIEEDKQQHVTEQFAPWFTLRDTLALNYRLPLDKEAIAHLIRMTPNYWHISPQAQPMIESVDMVQTEIAFTCLIFQRRLP